MNQQIHIDNRLFFEIKRYLAAVDLYRAEHCEPTWRPESTPFVSSDERLRIRAEPAPSAH
ncbi:MAG: hypothetical protein ACRDPV_11675 [Gaiellaceae bacterium]